MSAGGGVKTTVTLGAERLSGQGQRRQPELRRRTDRRPQAEGQRRPQPGQVEGQRQLEGRPRRTERKPQDPRHGLRRSQGLQPGGTGRDLPQRCLEDGRNRRRLILDGWRSRRQTRQSVSAASSACAGRSSAAGRCPRAGRGCGSRLCRRGSAPRPAPLRRGCGRRGATRSRG